MSTSKYDSLTPALKTRYNVLVMPLSFRADVFDGYAGDQITSFWAMKAGGVKLAIFKSSQGSGLIDKMIKPIKTLVGHITTDSYPHRAASTGMGVGAYHFGGNSDGRLQALRYLGIIESGWLMVIDYERYPNSQMTIAQLEAFIATIEAQTGRLPWIYYGELLLQQAADGLIKKDSIIRRCKAWISRYSSKQPSPIDGHDLVLWQFTGDGQGPMPHTVPGCANNADLSMWIGNLDDLPRAVAKYSKP